MRQLNVNTIPLQVSATVNGPAIDSENLFQVSAQIAASAGAAGTMKLQASNDVNENFVSQFAPANWSDIPSASILVTGPGAFLIPNTEVCYQWIRVVYTNTGTGTISVVFKALGA
jgi:hypothetical protein